MQLLQPFNTNLPANERQLSALFAAMRRMGHITENTQEILAPPFMDQEVEDHPIFWQNQ